MKWRSLEESAGTGDSRSLREIYAGRKQLIEQYVPAEITAIHSRVISELQQSGIASRCLQPGAQAPAFELPDQNRNVIRSADLLAQARLVVCFFRGRWCPFCVGQLEAMNSVCVELQSTGAVLVAISPQTPHQSFLMADQHHLRFPLLSDAHNDIARKFGLVYRVPEYQQQIYERAFVNLPFVNGDPSWELPIPATYVIDRDSTIMFASANPDYTERPEPRAILDVFHSFRAD